MGAKVGAGAPRHASVMQCSKTHYSKLAMPMLATLNRETGVRAGGCPLLLRGARASPATRERWCRRAPKRNPGRTATDKHDRGTAALPLVAEHTPDWLDLGSNRDPRHARGRHLSIFGRPHSLAVPHQGPCCCPGQRGQATSTARCMRNAPTEAAGRTYASGHPSFGLNIEPPPRRELRRRRRLLLGLAARGGSRAQRRRHARFLHLRSPLTG